MHVRSRQPLLKSWRIKSLPRSSTISKICTLLPNDQTLSLLLVSNDAERTLLQPSCYLSRCCILPCAFLSNFPHSVSSIIQFGKYRQASAHIMTAADDSTRDTRFQRATYHAPSKLWKLPPQSPDNSFVKSGHGLTNGLSYGETKTLVNGSTKDDAFLNGIKPKKSLIINAFVESCMYALYTKSLPRPLNNMQVVDISRLDSGAIQTTSPPASTMSTIGRVWRNFLRRGSSMACS